MRIIEQRVRPGPASIYEKRSVVTTADGMREVAETEAKSSRAVRAHEMGGGLHCLLAITSF